METSETRLDRDPRQARSHDPALCHRHRRVQHAAILGARIHLGAEHAAAAIRGPLLVAVWSLFLLGVRLTLAQAIGVLLSLFGVLVILLHGDLTALSNIEFNKGDIIFTVAMTIFGLYSVLTLEAAADSTACRSPRSLSVAARCACSAAGLGIVLASADGARTHEPAVAALCRDVSLDAGLSLLQSRRAADRRQPRRAVLPCGAGVRRRMAMVFLGERPQLSTSSALPWC